MTFRNRQNRRCHQCHLLHQLHQRYLTPPAPTVSGIPPVPEIHIAPPAPLHGMLNQQRRIITKKTGKGETTIIVESGQGEDAVEIIVKGERMARSSSMARKLKT